MCSFINTWRHGEVVGAGRGWLVFPKSDDDDDDDGSLCKNNSLYKFVLVGENIVDIVLS